MFQHIDAYRWSCILQHTMWLITLKHTSYSPDLVPSDFFLISLPETIIDKVAILRCCDSYQVKDNAAERGFKEQIHESFQKICSCQRPKEGELFWRKDKHITKKTVQKAEWLARSLISFAITEMQPKENDKKHV